MDNKTIATTILEQIKYGRTHDNKPGKLAMMCWGYNRPAIMEKGLAFRVQGAKLRGHVLVILDEARDLYSVRFYSTHKNLKAEYEGVFCEDLTSLIDSTVEA